MQSNHPGPRKKRASGERPAVRHSKPPLQRPPDETASKTDFAGQGDQRTNLDQDGNHAQAGTEPPRKTGDSK